MKTNDIKNVNESANTNEHENETGNNTILTAEIEVEALRSRHACLQSKRSTKKKKVYTLLNLVSGDLQECRNYQYRCRC